jgi:ABC-type multidrug transport system permease subunit
MSMGFAISAISPTAVIANALGPPVLIILLLFSGFYINTASLPAGSFWVTYISYIKWGFQVNICSRKSSYHKYLSLVCNEYAGSDY